MALLDRFRPAKDPLLSDDPAVRAEAVRTLPASETERLAGLFRSDPDLVVRRAALKKIDELAVLAEALRDSEASVQEEAREMLLRFAIEGLDSARAAQAGALLTEPRHLVAMARTARVAEVREAALARLTDERSVAVVAKTAEDAKLRLAALQRVDIAARADVALKSDHKDVAVAALEGLTDEAALREIAAHARAKPAARRAQAMLEAFSAKPLLPVAAALPDPDETPEARMLREARDHAVETRRVVLERVEALSGDDIDLGLGLIEAEAAWQRLSAFDDPAVLSIGERFRGLVATLRDAKARAERERQEKVRADADAAAQSEIEREKAERLKAEKELRARLNETVERARALAKSETLALKDADRAMREIRAALHDAPKLQAKKEAEALVEKLKGARAALYPRLQELRDADDWKRWANTQVQEELVAKIEALSEAPALAAAEHELQALNERWRQFSQARKEEAEGLWTRFKTAREKLQARLDEFEKQQQAEQAENQKQKLALIEKAETLAASREWLKTAEAVQALQAEWKTIGPTPRREQKPLWDRFHAACDRFFTARKEDLGKRRDEWAKNLEKKEALIEKAEALKDASDWDKTAEAIRTLQAEWKAAGPVRKNKADAIWARFKAACDAFSARYQQRDSIEAEAQRAARETLVAEILTLAPAEGDAAPEGLAARVQDVVSRWRQASGSPVPEAEARFVAARDALIARWPAAFGGTELDPEANLKKREKLVAKAENAVKAHAGTASSATSLAEQLREALATNAMGGRAVAEARWREAMTAIEEAQAAWNKVGPVPGEAGETLALCFKTACQAVESKRPAGASRETTAARPPRRESHRREPRRP